MPRRFAAVVTLILLVHVAARAAESRPNVLLIVADDQGTQSGCYGTPGVSTPAQDSLAARGVRFANTYCAYPSCSPSRASMLTGLYPHAHGLSRNVGEFFGPTPPPSFDRQYAPIHSVNFVPPTVPTLIETLNAAGYFTGITNKFHIVPHEKFPFTRWLAKAGAEDVQQFIADAQGKPFFLMVNFAAPHRPFSAWTKASERRVDPTRLVLPPFLPDVAVVRQDYADYLTSVEYADKDCAAVLDGLRRARVEDNTLIIYVGDNGPAFQRGKYSEYDFGARCPLIVAGPGVAKPGRASKAVTSFVDLMPTILDYAAAKPAAPMHGVSLRALLENRPDARAHDLVVSEVSFGKSPESYQGRASTDGRFQYIRRRNPDAAHQMCDDDYWVKSWGNPTFEATVAAKETSPLPFALIDLWMHHAPKEELFDLSTDPYTVKDIAGDPAYAADLARLRKLMDAHIEATDDKLMREPPATQPGS